MLADRHFLAHLTIFPATKTLMEFSIPTENGSCKIQIDAGSTTTFCGANGSGKTRLAVHIETELGLDAHRISAHRAQALNPHVAKIPEKEALSWLRVGVKDSNRAGHRRGFRWREHEAVHLLNDFDFLIQSLFADQTRTALQSHERLREGNSGGAKPTKFEQLSEIWEGLLPHRTLVIDGDDINVQVPGSEATYSASEMSDGERAIFYLIGQTLAAGEGSVLVVDEPELHLHPSIMAALWDKLTTARLDCAFVFITHNLEFAASRPGAKFVIRKYDPARAWTLDPVPEDTGFSEEFATLILGSRRPVLFVEGVRSSLDRIIFRSAYPDHLVLPLESCEAVIHAVASMRNNAALTHVSCHGIVDRDHRSDDEVRHLRARGVEVLSVAELENIVLLPDVSRAIACQEGFEGDGLAERLSFLGKAVFELLEAPGEKDAVAVRSARRRVDRLLKRIDLSDAKSVQELEERCKLATELLDVADLASETGARIQTAIDDNDLSAILELYDNKALFALAPKHLKETKVKSFREWLERVLGNGSAPQVSDAIRNFLPEIPKQ